MSKDIELKQRHLDAMKTFGVETLIPHDDIILFADPDWNGIHARKDFTGWAPKWVEFRAWIRRQPNGVGGYQLVNVRGSGYTYRKI